jgi:hypothetical protein
LQKEFKAKVPPKGPSIDRFEEMEVSSFVCLCFLFFLGVEAGHFDFTLYPYKDAHMNGNTNKGLETTMEFMSDTDYFAMMAFDFVNHPWPKDFDHLERATLYLFKEEVVAASSVSNSNILSS